jgi:outer membrane protein TolC
MTEALGELETARFAIVSGDQAVAVAEEDLRVQQERYAEGVSTLLDLLTSQVALDEARVNLIRSQFDYRVAKARIEALIGRSLQEDQ